MVERLLALVVAADGVAAAALAQGVEFVDEDDARGLGFRPARNRSRTRPAPTPTNISTKSRPAQAEERHLGLAGHGLGQQRLAGARRADEQHALGNAAAQRLVFFAAS